MDGDGLSQPAPATHNGPIRKESSLWRRYVCFLPSKARERAKRYVCFAVLVSLGMGFQAWATLQWRSNIHSDEVIWGLMARHVLQGHLPTYYYGQNYLGSLDAFLAAPFIYWLGSNGPALRASSVLLYGLFLLLYGILIERLWGTRTALIALLILAFPSLLTWTFGPTVAFGSMSVVGILMLLLSQMGLARSRWLRGAHLGVLGVLAGLGLWIHPMSLIYIASIALVAWLGAPEWRAIHDRLQLGCASRLRGLFRGLLLLGTLTGLGTAALFMRGCNPRELFATVSQLAMVLLIAIGGTLGILALAVSQRRKELFAHGVCLASGFVLGSAPMWRAWAFLGVSPSSASILSCTGLPFVRGRLVVTQLIPAMWGMPIQGSPPQLGSWVSLVLVMLVASGGFLWTYRKTLWSLFTASPLSQADWRRATVVLLFVLPLGLAVIGTNIYNMANVRYLVISWQASAVILAVFLSRMARRPRTLALVLLGLWMVQMSLVRPIELDRQWYDRRGSFSSEAVSDLEGFLAGKDVGGGYASYWDSYVLDFLTEERLVFAPLSGPDRYPIYSEKVARLPVQAYVLAPGLVPLDAADGGAMVRALQTQESINVRPSLLQHLNEQVVVERQRIANWDVWLVTDKQK